MARKRPHSPRIREEVFSDVQSPSQTSSIAKGGWTLSLHGLFLLGDY
jgi:hypothetical protein